MALAVGSATLSMAQTDTTRRAGGAVPPGASAAASTQPKAYSAVITDKAVTQRGMFTTHKIDDKYFFEIPDSLLGRDILVITRISKASADLRAAQTYSGDQINSNVIRFEKGPNNRVFLRKVSYRVYSPDSTSSMYQNVQRNNIQAIAASFNIAAFSNAKDASVIDVTTYINSDNEILYFSSPAAKTRARLGAQQADRSYITAVKSFPGNVDVSAVKTYALAAAPATGGAPAGAASGFGTLELKASMVLLPKVPMKPRLFDPRVAYFTVGYTDFDANPQGVKEISLAKRWRLEPKPQDMAKYLRGELVEPIKPIVFYIDPATPKKWVKYLIQGVNDWQKAFEKAGFKNAIIGKEAPTPQQDPTWSIDDARNSVIVYKPSEIANASGPSTSDPRSGEILESHINWFHNIQSLLRDWYFIQTANVDPRARKMELDEDLMGELIRFVSAHEVGHTLGLRHNHGSSSTVPVEKLRDKAWVEANGHTPSMMDYARFNYVAQPEDKIGPKGLFPRVGAYDEWSIDWGYRIYNKENIDDQSKINARVVEASKNPFLWFGTESNPDDPRSQSEDLSDNAMVASTYGIKNLQAIIKNLPEWTKTKNEGYDNLKNMYTQLRGQFGRYMGHVNKNIGGLMETPKTLEQAGNIYERTPAAKQREAMAFLDAQLFKTPKWIIDQNMLDKTGENALDVIHSLQNPTMSRLLGASTLTKLINGELADGPSAYKINDFFADMENSIFSELKTNGPIDLYRRNLQKSYVDKLIAVAYPAPAAATATAGFGRPTSVALGDAQSYAKGQLKALNAKIKSATVAQGDSRSKFHLEDLSDKIETALDKK